MKEQKESQMKTLTLRMKEHKKMQTNSNEEREK